jgi:hypothetical protein
MNYNPLQEFKDEHGKFEQENDLLYFIDGAIAEHTSLGVGRLMPPPADDYERLQNIAKYFLLVAHFHESKFVEMKAYLSGTGMRPEGAEKLYTEQAHLDHLCSLSTKVRRTRATYYQAKREAEAAKPKWMDNFDSTDIDQARQQHEFRAAVDEVNI